MKKKLCVFLVLALCLSMLAACGSEAGGQPDATGSDNQSQTGTDMGGKTDGQPGTPAETHTHTWVDATCTAPKTCTCGATEGEIAPHAWQDATCITPKTCSVCSATEGEVAAHTWVDATFTAPKTCSVCGATEGEIRQADFEKHNLSVVTPEAGKTYEYVTCNPDYPNFKTRGEVYITDYAVFESDENHPAKEGYQWHHISFQLSFGDDNARNFGLAYGWLHANYYDSSDSRNTETHTGIRDGLSSCLVNHNGEEMEVVYTGRGEFYGWVDATAIYLVDRYVQIPVGYDGAVIGFWDRGVTLGDDLLASLVGTNPLLFRLSGV